MKEEPLPEDDEEAEKRKGKLLLNNCWYIEN